jgi:glycerol-3-phosphate cytidylyltransferase
MVGFTCSSFDLLHAGHAMMLKECADNCDRLIVGLNVNPVKDNKYPVQSVVERYTQLEAIAYIDQIIPYNTEKELIDILQLYPIDIRFIGDDYRGKPFTGDTLPIDIFYNRRQHTFSSKELKERVRNQADILEGNTVKDNDTYKLIDNTTLEAMTISTTTLHPKQSTNGHSHSMEEVYHFLSGTGIISINDIDHCAEAGKTFVIKPEEFHRVSNVSAHDDLAFFCVFSGVRDH